MIDQSRLAAALALILQDGVAVVIRLDSGSSSNEVYHIQTATGAAYVVKVAKEIREEFSPFWRQMAALFGSTIHTQLAGMSPQIEALR